MGDRVAVVGGGIAGLTAGYLLRRKHEVELFERQERLGGNAYTLETAAGETVDIAVAAFGRAGYPNFYRLLAKLGVKTSTCLSSYMSFHDLDTGRGMYITPQPAGLFAQRFRLLGPRHLGAILRLFRSVKLARRLLHEGELEGLNLGQALEKIPGFRGNSWIALMCALCLLSSMSAAEVLDAPAEFFIHKLDVHRDVISPRAVTSVRAVRGWTRAYVQALAASLGERAHIGLGIKRIKRGGGKALLECDDGRVREFDRVVLACNADQALAMLAEPTDDERALLGAWKYKDGRLVLHRDHTSFPRRSLLQAYTFLYTLRSEVLETSVNGVVRYEPGVSRKCDLISSQHPNFPIRDDLIEFSTTLRTPVFDFQSCATIDRLPSLNGVLGTYHCGSHFGHGLHEDAVASAIRVASMLGVEF